MGDDSVTLFTVKDRTLTKGGAVTLEAKAEPRAVFIAKDGKTAWALRFGDGKVTKLAIKGDSCRAWPIMPWACRPMAAR